MSNKQVSSKPTLTLKDVELCQTEDQSWTVLHKELDAHYRSMHGAESESEWVFVRGTKLLEQPAWNIAELGFGLGTNLSTVLTIRAGMQKPPPLRYIGLDHQPIPSALMKELMPDSMYRDWLMDLLVQIERGESIAVVEIPNKDIRLELQVTELHNANIQPQWATAFFHDPFGPSTNPEAWTLDTFRKIYGWMNPNGILSTYGAAGHARRAMASAGFWTASTKGFGRKREMTIASPNREQLSHGMLIRKYPPLMELR